MIMRLVSISVWSDSGAGSQPGTAESSRSFPEVSFFPWTATEAGTQPPGRGGRSPWPPSRGAPWTSPGTSSVGRGQGPWQPLHRAPACRPASRRSLLRPPCGGCPPGQPLWCPTSRGAPQLRRGGSRPQRSRSCSRPCSYSCSDDDDDGP